MKKIIAFGITLFLLFSMSIPVFADLGPADFDEWYVLCGTEGYYFEDVPDEYAPDYEQAGVDMHDYIEPGIRLWVYSFDNTANEYMLIIRDSNHKTIGRGFVDVPEADFEKYFIDEHDTIPEETGEKLPEEVECVVTADSGLVLRQGPARTFPSYQVIPSQANISYQYTFDYGGYHWGVYDLQRTVRLGMYRLHREDRADNSPHDSACDHGNHSACDGDGRRADRAGYGNGGSCRECRLLRQHRDGHRLRLLVGYHSGADSRCDPAARQAQK